MSPSTTTTVTTTLRRGRGLTEEAATAAVDQACRRLRLPTIRAVVDEACRRLRLPTIRAVVDEAVKVAEKELTVLLRVPRGATDGRM